jgi:predicted nucleic acid-binding protein
MADPPSWLQVRAVRQETGDPRLAALAEGGREAIGLAREVGADLVILDDREAREAARQLGFQVTGLLGVLDAAADRGLVELRRAVARLRGTRFRATPGLLRTLLERGRRS